VRVFDTVGIETVDNRPDVVVELWQLVDEGVLLVLVLLVAVDVFFDDVLDVVMVVNVVCLLEVVVLDALFDFVLDVLQLVVVDVFFEAVVEVLQLVLLRDLLATMRAWLDSFAYNDVPLNLGRNVNHLSLPSKWNSFRAR
jgi:hypothetical protein